MDMKFESEEIRFLRPVVWEEQRQEQTQEIRLTDDLPDAGRVLGCWGQCILRSKEWRSGAMAASGGVMTWTLYAPEDGSEPRCVESWVPFQIKWSFPPTDTDGLMSVCCGLHCADARVVSARKLMLRVSVNALGIGTCGEEAAVFTAGEVPEDVQLLRSTYPVTVPVEAGEKALQIDEELELPGDGQERKLLRCLMNPRLQEQRIIGDRLVFRGNAKLNLLLSENGKIRSENLDVPFSAFSDLDREYDGDGTAQIDLAVTGLEAEITEEGRLRLKAGLAAQYILWSRKMLDIVEDAWSHLRDIRLQQQILMLPALLEHRVENCTSVGKVHQNMVMVDGLCLADSVSKLMEDGKMVLTLPANVQILCRDENGSLQGTNVQMQGRILFDQEEGNLVCPSPVEAGPVQTSANGQDMEVRCDLSVPIRTVSGQGITMVSGMELGETRPADPDRPCVILRRNTGETLWEMAKAGGSTVEAIREANGLAEEPEAGRMILIPVQ